MERSRKHRKQEVASNNLECSHLSLFLNHKAQDPVVRSDKVLPVGFEHHRSAVGSNSWIDDNHVHGPIGEVGCSLGNCVRAGKERIGRDMVGDVDDLCCWTGTQNDTLHRSDVMVGEAKISRQGYGRRSRKELVHC